MRQFIITWTTTLEADSEEEAMRLAEKALDEGGISPDMEELTGAEKVDLS